MYNFSANINLLFNEVNFADRFELASKYGFNAVELWHWWGYSKEFMKEKLMKNGLILSSILRGGANKDFKSVYENGITFGGKNKELFVEMIEETVDYAYEMDVECVIITAGKDHASIPRSKQYENVVEALLKASTVCNGTNIKLVLEPHNRIQFKKEFLHSTKETISIINDINHPNVMMLYDFYHQQITEGDLLRTVKENFNNIGLYHFADNPGGSEPGTGEINYSNIFKFLYNMGYSGYVVAEYHPSVATENTLSFFDYLK